MGESMQQNPDGSWSESQPLGWQGHQIDWEIYSDGPRLRANGYDEDMLIEVVRARTRWGLARKMRQAERRHGMSGTVLA